MIAAKSPIKDPVCGMAVDPVKALHMDHDGKTYYFCSENCRIAFPAIPLKITSSNPPAAVVQGS